MSILDLFRSKPAPAPARPPPALTEPLAVVLAPAEMRAVPIVTARELYAAHALGALIARAQHSDMRTIVQDAHKHADALVKELGK